MTNIQQSVTNFIDQDVSIRRGLHRGIINVRSLAKFIQKNISGNPSLDAVISAIRRYQKDGSIKDKIKRSYMVIAAAKVFSRTNMASLLFDRSQDVRQALSGVYKRIDPTKGEMMRVIETTQHIKVILDESLLAAMRVPGVIKTEKDLGEISIIFKEDVDDIPGIFSALAGELAISGISIIDGMICGNEHIFIVNEDDLLKALQAMHRIAKWGKKNQA
jgi:hypothetical protein